ncbi:hypothetical protein [Reichenbachiella agariperforans]|uniref:hypothetical protein n=1 Tax=Reichenbachiella agariperforans TaxID=156994 RepID=UPI001C08B060|nr:hypothetical protein [Reichenbachiella agariperforans]MBU2914549.1 hypothetical protein [Reichenbachiella agariperforans]
MNNRGKISISHHLEQSKSKKAKGQKYTIYLRVIAQKKVASYKSNIYDVYQDLEVNSGTFLDKLSEGETELDSMESSVKRFLVFERNYLLSILHSLDVLDNPNFEIKKVRNIKPIDSIFSYFNLFDTVLEAYLYFVLREQGLTSILHLFKWHNGMTWSKNKYDFIDLNDQLESAKLREVSKLYHSFEFTYLRELSELGIDRDYEKVLPHFLTPSGYMYSSNLLGMYDSVYSEKLRDLANSKSVEVSMIIRKLLAKQILTYERRVSSENILKYTEMTANKSKIVFQQIVGEKAIMLDSDGLPLVQE